MTDNVARDRAGQAPPGRVVQAHVVFLRDDAGRPCDKTCAEKELAAEIVRQQGAYFADERVQPTRRGTPAGGGSR